MKNPETNSDMAKHWNGSIAVKVTAVTIWTILVLSFIMTLPFVSSFEETLKKDYKWQQLEIESALKNNFNEETTRAEAIEILSEQFNKTEATYIRLDYANEEINLGLSSSDHYLISSEVNSPNQKQLLLQVEFPSLEYSIKIARIEVGSAIVGFSVLFGLLLFWINKKIVHAPFSSIIELTQKISSGENSLRLDTSRGDEFGILSKFMNQMLDTLEENEAALKKANIELLGEVKNREEALAASQLKSAFLANMSHEIRTPLSSIIGYTERIRFHKARSKIEEQKMLDIVLQNGNHLLQLINDILDLSKVEANKLEIEKCDFSIFNVVDHTQRLLQDKAVEQETRLLVEYDFPIPETIHNDPIRTKQILLNLTSNAIRFTENGTVTIGISYDQNTDELVLVIKDTGIGMNAEQLGRMFKPFSQADETISRKYGGTGLGLVISKRLAELMEGDITVQSVEGLGTRFCCRFRAGYNPNSNRLVADKNAISSTNPTYEEPETNLVLQGKILLVEDTIEIQGLVKAYLEDYGIEIDVASNGEEGVTKALSNDYDLVLMDVQMPVMNGKTATRKLREQQYKKPIIALTADALTQHTDEFIEIGFTRTLTKPIIINDLLVTLKHFLSHNETSAASNISHFPSPTENEETDPAILDLQEKFINQLPDYINSFENAMQDRDIPAANAVLHKLKGIGGTLGYPEITQLSSEITALIKDENIELAEAKVDKIRSYFVK